MLVPASMHIVGLRLRMRLNPADWASERLHGLEYLFFLRELSRRIETEWPSVHSELEALSRALIQRDNLILNVTADRSILETSLPALQRLTDALPAPSQAEASIAKNGTIANTAIASTAPRSNVPHHSAAAPSSWIEAATRACGDPMTRAESIELPTQVNSVGMAMQLGGLDPLAGAALVASKYLDTAYLWEQVRVMGGAYGCYSNLDVALQSFYLHLIGIQISSTRFKCMRM